MQAARGLGAGTSAPPRLLAGPLNFRFCSRYSRTLQVRASGGSDSEPSSTNEQPDKPEEQPLPQQQPEGVQQGEPQQGAPPKRRRGRPKKSQVLSLETMATSTIELGRKSREAFDEGGFALLNPITMGRKSREVFDDVWAQLQRLGTARSVDVDDDFRLSLGGEFEAPRASETTVLVAGATGRVGRILVRKLLLRGYKVRALVRRRGRGKRRGKGSSNGKDGEQAAGDIEGVRLPPAVKLVFGDLADYAACRRAVEGADKVVWCAGAKTTLTAELERVEEKGIANLSKALLDYRYSGFKQGVASAYKQRQKQQQQRQEEEGDEQQQQQEGEQHAGAAVAGQPAEWNREPVGKVQVVDFRKKFYHQYWDIEKVGVPETEGGARRRIFDRGQDRAEAYINEDDNLVFTGAVYSRGGLAQVGAPLVSPFADRLQRLQRTLLEGTQGLLLNVKGDDHSYIVELTTDTGHAYNAKFQAPSKYAHARLPYDSFIPADSGAPPLNPGAVNHISIKFEPRQVQSLVTRWADDSKGASPFNASTHSFRLEIDWIKALPGGDETDFVLVSCAGRRPDLSELSSRKVQSYKGRGEEVVRKSGLGYTVVRPGPLQEEAGGYKALVFDQGGRIREGISCADVADVCLKALHDPLARNKTFEVCWEYTPEEGLEQYELVAHLPDKSNNYLSPALASLRSNT
ncbi:hypothetical protein N2152v2_008187 [Parachlorella kessleri]